MMFVKKEKFVEMNNRLNELENIDKAVNALVKVMIEIEPRFEEITELVERMYGLKSKRNELIYIRKIEKEKFNRTLQSSGEYYALLDYYEKEIASIKKQIKEIVESERK